MNTIQIQEKINKNELAIESYQHQIKQYKKRIQNIRNQNLKLFYQFLDEFKKELA